MFVNRELSGYINVSYGVTGNTSAFGAEESRFEPLWDNNSNECLM